ncbi:MAG: DUF2207 domain-containing protein [Deltaproteobacteria bacterium]|nr:DUF2207 domain-containing protein [Deltaproteobacteria bacterium]
MDFFKYSKFLLVPTLSLGTRESPLRLGTRGIASIAAFFPALFFLSLVLSFPSTASSAERILSYHGDITVNADSTLVVEETIKVVSDGNAIKRGIYRDFPLKYPGKWGMPRINGFEILGITRDGNPEPYHTEYAGNGVRVYIGSKNVFIENGDHTYAIRYSTDRQLGFFEGRDELYWNVTGNGWVFPIEKASASVTLPNGIRPDDLTLSGYTGPAGSKAKDFIHSIDAVGNAHFSAAKTLKSYEGLTIAVSWPKGFVTEPTSYMRFRYFLRDAKLLIAAVFGIVILLVYYLYVWGKVGKDPEAGVIMPIYGPPTGFSPASVRYVMEMGYDAKAFTAMVLGLAVKGFLKIEEKAKKYTIIKTGKVQMGTPPLPEEEKFYERLPASLVFEQSNHSEISAAIKALKDALSSAYNKKYFFTNYVYLIPGVAITLLSFAAFALTGDVSPAMFPGMFIITVFVSIFAAVTAAIFKVRSVKAFAFFFTAAFSVVIAVGYLLSPEQSSAAVVVAGGAFLTMLVVNFVFSRLLKAPTVIGRRLMDKIEGFKMYLSAAEGDRLNRMNPPDKTPALFEAYLPYALALNVENEWAEQFTEVFKKISAETGRQYSPAWYTGAAWGAMGAGGFASSIGSSFTGAVSSSSTAPGSSSGGGGGGSSGGGGGGGGGGGW